MEEYIKVFVVGGILCSLGQILIDETKLSTARILVLFVTVGCILGGLGIYEKLVDFAGCGATIPITGYGYTLAKGVMEEVDKEGLLGIFTGGMKATSGGIAATIVFSVLASVFSNPKEKG